MTSFFNPVPRSLAHRGNSREYPENTEPAFRSALKAGADVIETDVHLLKDGQVVISHDDSFERLARDRRKINEIMSGELKALDAGWSFSGDGGLTYPYRDGGIHPLLLKDALTLFPDARFNIDLKDPGKNLAAAAAAVIREAGAERRVCVGSFHHSALKAFRKAQPETATSLSRREIIGVLLFYRFGWYPSSVKRGSAVAVQIPEYAGPFRIPGPSFFKWCRKKKLHLQIWTINDESKMRALFDEGVEGIFSDDASLITSVAGDLFDPGSSQT